MKAKILGGLLMIAVLAVTSAAKADTVTNKHQNKKNKLELRLKADMRKGEITRAEAKHFHKEEKRIHEEKRMAKSNGTYTPAERKRIQSEKKMLTRDLRREEQKKIR